MIKSLIIINAIVLVIVSISFYAQMKVDKKPIRHRVIETEISHVDTVYTTPPAAVRFDFGTIDTTWHGNDVGLKVLNKKIKPDADFNLIIICIDGYQYYAGNSDDSFSPRVMNGPNGMIAVPCKISSEVEK